MLLMQKIMTLWQRALQKIPSAIVKDNPELEEIAERIHLPQTKKYFTEVLSCYRHGNYRSAVVMLWSVVIFDIIEKLHKLVGAYGDKPATEILKYIKEQEKYPNPSWEKELLKKIHDKTELLDQADYTNLCHLQEKRHLSAHSVISGKPGDRELHSPNQDTTKALIREALKSVLNKPYFYTRNILDIFLEDISANSINLPTNDLVKKYIYEQYLNRMRQDIQLQIYKSFWRLVFKTNNDNCNKNRKINFQVLEVIGEINEGQLDEFIKSDKEYYSEISPNYSILSFLLVYLAKKPNLYGSLGENAHAVLAGLEQRNPTARVLSRFKQESLMEHFSALVEYFNDNRTTVIVEWYAWSTLAGVIKTNEEWEMFRKVISIYYATSINYDTADARFANVVKPYLNTFAINDFIFMLGEIEKNHQTYDRRHAKFDHSLIANRVMELSPSFNKDKHPKFFHGLN